MNSVKHKQKQVVTNLNTEIWFYR